VHTCVSSVNGGTEWGQATYDVEDSVQVERGVDVERPVEDLIVDITSACRARTPARERQRPLRRVRAICLRIVRVVAGVADVLQGRERGVGEGEDVHVGLHEGECGDLRLEDVVPDYRCELCQYCTKVTERDG
jgi:hypothetical protein